MSVCARLCERAAWRTGVMTMWTARMSVVLVAT